MPESITLALPQQSVAAYDDAARVAAYDAKMEIMHPNRRKMAEIVGAMLPFPREAEITLWETPAVSLSYLYTSNDKTATK